MDSDTNQNYFGAQQKNFSNIESISGERENYRHEGKTDPPSSDCCVRREKWVRRRRGKIIKRLFNDTETKRYWGKAWIIFSSSLHSLRTRIPAKREHWNAIPPTFLSLGRFASRNAVPCEEIRMILRENLLVDTKRITIQRILMFRLLPVVASY